MTNDNYIIIRRNGIFVPPSLKKGDKIAILSPASAVKEEYVLGAMSIFKEQGYEPVLMQYAIGHECGSYSATKGDRIMDLLEAFEDDEIKMIFCSRGGYGCGQLLANFSYSMVSAHPKWLVGFSDVSALLAMMYVSDVASIHGPMAKHLAKMPSDDPCTTALFKILETGGKFEYSFPSDSRNIEGKAIGVLRGGNLAVLNDLASTPYDILTARGTDDEFILFFEDISEPIYAVERMLMRLYLTDTIFRCKGMIFGKFTNYKPDKNYEFMEDMLRAFTQLPLFPDIPVAFNFPIGHVDENYPLVVGAKVEFEVTSSTVTLKTIK